MTDRYSVGTHDGQVSTYTDSDGRHWWVCTCGMTAAHGRTSRRGARRDGDKHLNRAIKNRPSRRERLKPALEAASRAEAIALPSRPEPFRGSRKAQGELEEELYPAPLEPTSDSPRKPLVLTWYGDEND